MGRAFFIKIIQSSHMQQISNKEERYTWRNYILAFFTGTVSEKMFVLLVVRRHVRVKQASVASTADVQLYDVRLQRHFMSRQCTFHLHTQKQTYCLCSQENTKIFWIHEILYLQLEEIKNYLITKCSHAHSSNKKTLLGKSIKDVSYWQWHSANVSSTGL